MARRKSPFILRAGFYWVDTQTHGRRVRYSLGLPASTPLHMLWRAYERAEAERQESLRRSRIDDAFDQVVDAKRANRNHKTGTCYKTVLGNFQRYLARRGIVYLDQLRPEHLNAYSAQLRSDGRRRRGINSDLTHIRSALNLLDSWGYMPDTYDSKPWFASAFFRDIPKRQRIYSEMELRALFADPQFGDLYKFLYLSGQRVGVVLQLHVSHIDRKRGVISFARGKRGQLQDIPLTPQLRDHLDSLDPGNNGYYFWPDDRPLPTTDGRVRDYSQAARKRLRKILKDNKYPPGRVHDIRATTATHLAPHMSMLELMHYMGWTQPDTAKLYYRQRPEDLRVPDLPAAPSVTPASRRKTGGANS